MKSTGPAYHSDNGSYSSMARYPAKIRMDNGPKLTSVKMAEWAEEHGVKLKFIQPGKPTQNSYVERFN